MEKRMISEILDSIKGLTVKELLELTKACEEEFGVSAAVQTVIPKDPKPPVKKTEFDESKVDTSDLIKVLFVRPNEDPYVAEIPDTLEAKQKAVGGYIEYIYNSDETALVGDEEAKLKGKVGNRYLDGGGIIAGNFLVVGLGDEDCRSLTNEEIEKYTKKYSNAPSISPEETAADVGFKYINFM